MSERRIRCPNRDEGGGRLGSGREGFVRDGG